MRAFASLLIFASVARCLSQGTVNFANGAAGVNAPVIDYRMVPAVFAAGPAYRAQLYVGPAGTSNPALLTTNGVSGTPAPFATSPAGYFFGGPRTIAGSPDGTILTMQVRVWALVAGPNWETADVFSRGESNLIQVGLGGIGPTPNLVGLGASPTFTGLQFTPVPEPSGVALGTMGLLVTLVFGMRRRALHR